MLQYNLLEHQTTPKLGIGMMLILFVGVTSLYFLKVRDFAYPKTQYDFYLEYLKTHEVANDQSRIASLSIHRLHRDLDDLLALLPAHMQLEKMIMQKHDIWLSGYVLEHQAFYHFWHEIKQHLKIKQVYLLNMEHTKPPETMDAWRFAVKMSF